MPQQASDITTDAPRHKCTIPRPLPDANGMMVTDTLSLHVWSRHSIQSIEAETGIFSDHRPIDLQVPTDKQCEPQAVWDTQT